MRLIALLVALLCSIDCLSAQSLLVHKSYRSTVTVTVIWAKNLKEVDFLCRTSKELHDKSYKIAGCTTWTNGAPTIITIEPKDFSDHNVLDTLGHEFWHTLGAEHK